MFTRSLCFLYFFVCYLIQLLEIFALKNKLCIYFFISSFILSIQIYFQLLGYLLRCNIIQMPRKTDIVYKWYNFHNQGALTITKLLIGTFLFIIIFSKMMREVHKYA